MSQYAHFTDDEIRGLDAEFVKKLEKARELAGVPFIITSGLRTPEENQSLPGAVFDSAHLYGLAADLKCVSSNDRFIIMKSLILSGFNRIGIYTDGHIHVDDDPTKPTNVMWVIA